MQVPRRKQTAGSRVKFRFAERKKRVLFQSTSRGLSEPAQSSLQCPSKKKSAAQDDAMDVDTPPKRKNPTLPAHLEEQRTRVTITRDGPTHVRSSPVHAVFRCSFRVISSSSLCGVFGPSSAPPNSYSDLPPSCIYACISLLQFKRIRA